MPYFPPRVSIMNCHEDNGHEEYIFEVIGAGIDAINGMYEPTNVILHGYPIYSKNGCFNDQDDDSFYMWHGWHARWSISTFKKGPENLKRRDKISYYSFRNDGRFKDKPSISPPTFGWDVLYDGVTPAPKVVRIRKESHGRLLQRLSSKGTLEKILFSEKHSDIHFHCEDGNVLHAHKVILASESDYFSTVFEGPWKDSHENGVWKTINNVHVMKAILSFIYTGTVNEEEIIIQPYDIVVAAHEYQLIDLLEVAETILIRNIQLVNLKDTLQYAHLYGLNRLKRACFEFIVLNVIDVLMDKIFMKLANEQADLWSELHTFLT